MSNQGVKHDSDKARWELLPWDALDEVVQVLNFGAKKYGARNWEQGFNWSRILASAMRHLTSWAMGKDRDEETNISHLAHAACNILFLLTFDIRKIGEDDRRGPKT